MSMNRYFQDELAYLREVGAEFARENPRLAPYLGRESSDPDVERLLAWTAAPTQPDLQVMLPSAAEPHNRPRRSSPPR